ncbi:hypothetical protein N431DRAFT_515615, partial [Stipitochalara longipes BDJ]
FCNMTAEGPRNASADRRKSKARGTFKMFQPDSGSKSLPGPSKVLEAPTGDFEFINTNRPDESASTNVRKAVRVHVMRQFHKKSREQAAVTDRNRDQLDCTMLPDVSLDEDTGVTMRLAVSPPTDAAVLQVEPFRLPIRAPHEDTNLIEINPASLDTRARRSSTRLIGPASHNEITGTRFRLVPRGPPDSIRPGLIPPLPGVSQMDSSSLQLIQFFLEIVARSSIPMSPVAEHDYFKEVTTGNPAFRHGTLLLAYTYQALLRGAPVPEACHYHSALTIRYINSSLESVEGQIADGTLAAIACLAAFENAVDPVTNSSVHIAGMEELVKLRRTHQCQSAEYLAKLGRSCSCILQPHQTAAFATSTKSDRSS